MATLHLIPNEYWAKLPTRPVASVVSRRAARGWHISAIKLLPRVITKLTTCIYALDVVLSTFSNNLSKDLRALNTAFNSKIFYDNFCISVPISSRTCRIAYGYPPILRWIRENFQLIFYFIDINQLSHHEISLLIDKGISIFLL